MLLVTEVLYFLPDLAPFFKVALFLVLILIAMFAYSKSKFAKLGIIVTVVVQIILFVLAGIFWMEDSCGGFVCFPIGEILGIGLDFLAGLLGLIAWWRFRQPAYSLKWLLFISLGFLLVLPAWFIQTKLLRPLFEPLSLYLGERAAEQRQDFEDKRLAAHDRSMMEYPKLAKEFENQHYVSAINYSNIYNPMLEVVNGSTKIYIYLVRPVSSNFSIAGYKKWGQKLETLVGQQVMVELREIGDFERDTLGFPESFPDSDYLAFPVQEIILKDGTRVYEKFCVENKDLNCVNY